MYLTFNIINNECWIKNIPIFFLVLCVIVIGCVLADSFEAKDKPTATTVVTKVLLEDDPNNFILNEELATDPNKIVVIENPSDVSEINAISVILPGEVMRIYQYKNYQGGFISVYDDMENYTNEIAINTTSAVGSTNRCNIMINNSIKILKPGITLKIMENSYKYIINTPRGNIPNIEEYIDSFSHVEKTKIHWSDQYPNYQGSFISIYEDMTHFEFPIGNNLYTGNTTSGRCNMMYVNSIKVLSLGLTITINLPNNVVIVNPVPIKLRTNIPNLELFLDILPDSTQQNIRWWNTLLRVKYGKY